MSAAPSFGPAVSSPLDDTHEPSTVPQPQHQRPSCIGSGRVSLSNLTDPVFQDLDRNSRYYLAHFADRVCKDLVARDAPGINPFRELIPLTNRHPLLLHILVATSAIHWSNIFRPITAIPTGLTDPGGYLAQLRSKDLVSRQALIDALTAKQKAMGHLREVLDTLDPAGSEVALAAMHFFVKFDLIDLERNDDKGWQTHLEGASSILALLAPGSGASSYHILGSTLASGALAARIARYAFELLPVMKRVEVNSYLSCPSEILQVILVASQLSYETPCTDWSLSAADEALALIDQALAFDIPAWAAQLQRQPNVTDIESGVHVASAHRSAACLYILQALPLARAVRPVDTDFLVGDILGHLGQIGEGDPYFKATSWPTFIAGAETRDAEKRTWSLKRLLAIWEICSWGYIFTAIEMLKATWAMQDRAAIGRAAVPGVNWLQGLKDMGFDYLIV
ncbi:Acriflavine sensitivity control protein acr-2 [Tolypocladium ophioglossoides CBS 100239]|uniref:Acriflavine sensitivity control protein acr-2 n=1 Tax=Tolypocladium ophioglossoides (strain CBS 100239) TaxID=1163406 RepID=A0A0L0ND50_TOLOC|nr:Acriflavine sensitivity control protein acr-2 [Tolypocladium ophioglossoides CBS 100239]